MKDKFKENFAIALPAALLSIVAYSLFSGAETSLGSTPISWLKVIPYVSILIMAGLGVNVFVVLSLGLALAGAVGLADVDTYSMASFTQDIYKGFQSNQEIFLLSIFVGGLSRLMEKQGGLAFITSLILRLVKRFSGFGTRAKRNISELGIAALVSAVNICTANNTVAIVVAGKASKQIARENGISAQRSASILDIYACVIQGMIPYGAQALVLGTVFRLSPIEIVSYSFYPIFLFCSALLISCFKK